MIPDFAKQIVAKIGERFALNLRNAMIAGGTALIVNGTKGLIDESQAIAIMTPLADIVIGFLIAAIAWLWGNLVMRKDDDTESTTT